MSTSSSPSPSKSDVKTCCDEAEAGDGSRTSTSDSSGTGTDSEYHDTFNIDVDVDDSVISNEAATQTELKRQMTTRSNSNENGSPDLLIKELTDKSEGSSSSCEYYDSFDFEVDDNVVSKVTEALQPPAGNLALVNVTDQHVEAGPTNVNFLGEEKGKDDTATAHTYGRQETKLVEDANLNPIAKNYDANRVAPPSMSSTIASDDENEFVLANANSSPSHMDGIIDVSFNDVPGNVRPLQLPALRSVAVADNGMIQGTPTSRSKHSKSSSFQCFRNIEDISRFVNSIISEISGTDTDDSEEDTTQQFRFPSLSQNDACRSLQYLGSRSWRPSELATEGKTSRSSHSPSHSRSQNSLEAAGGQSLESNNCSRREDAVDSSSSNFYSEPTGEFVDMRTVPNFYPHNQGQGQQQQRERNRRNGSSTVKGSPLPTLNFSADATNIHGTEHDGRVFSVFCNLISAAFHRQTENLISDEIPLRLDSLLREIPMSGPMLQLSSVDWFPTVVLTAADKSKAEKFLASKKKAAEETEVQVLIENENNKELKFLENSEVMNINPAAPIAVGVENSSASQSFPNSGNITPASVPVPVVPAPGAPVPVPITVYRRFSLRHRRNLDQSTALTIPEHSGISSAGTALEYPYQKTNIPSGCISVGKINSVRKPIQTKTQKRPLAPRVKNDVNYYMSNKNIVTKEAVRQNLEEWNISVSNRKIEELHDYLNTKLEKLLDELTGNSGRPNGMFTYKHLEAALKREGLLPPELGKNGLLIMFADTLLSSDYNKIKGVLIPKDGENDTYEF